jgi:hypothetical protein
MSNNKHRKLKRHPLVRFIRGVFRLFRVLCRPQRDLGRLDDQTQEIARLNAQRQAELEEIRLEREKSITVGELFAQVKWQSSLTIISKKITTHSRDVQAHDVSRN